MEGHDGEVYIGLIVAILLISFGIALLIDDDFRKFVRNLFSFIPSVAYDRLGDNRPNIYMRLNEFKKIYAVNPDVYQLYLITADRYYGGRDYIIGFRGIDFYRYKRWRKKVLKIDSSNIYDETYREFMTTAVQKDIDKLAKKAQEEMDRGRKEMMQAMESNGELKL